VQDYGELFATVEIHIMWTLNCVQQKQIFLAPHRRIEEKEEQQQKMEKAFENLYMTATGLLFGIFILQVLMIVVDICMSSDHTTSVHFIVVYYEYCTHYYQRVALYVLENELSH